MSFQEFCEAVLAAANDAYGTDASPILRTVLKNNDIERTALSVQRTNAVCSPMVYLESYYTELIEGASIGSLIDDILHYFRGNYSGPPLFKDEIRMT